MKTKSQCRRHWLVVPDIHRVESNQSEKIFVDFLREKSTAAAAEGENWDNNINNNCD